MTTLTTCRFCSGDVDTTALKCRHCGEWLAAPQPANAALPAGQHPSQPSSRDYTLREGRPAYEPASTRVGWCSAAALGFGTLLPFLQMPLLGSISLWNTAKGDGAIIAVAAVLAGVALWRRMRWLAVLAAVAAAGVLAYDAIQILRALGGAPMLSFGFGFYAMIAGCCGVLWSAFTELD